MHMYIKTIFHARNNTCPGDISAWQYLGESPTTINGGDLNIDKTI